LQLQVAPLVAVTVLLALHKLVLLVAPFPLMAPQQFLLVAPLMQQEVLALLQPFSSLEHIWFLLVVVAEVQAQAPMVALAVQAPSTEPVAAVAVQETAPTQSSAATAAQAAQVLS
jgi:hypothetical protein